jgi:hypothetical protein
VKTGIPATGAWTAYAEGRLDLGIASGKAMFSYFGTIFIKNPNVISVI